MIESGELLTLIVIDELTTYGRETTENNGKSRNMLEKKS